MPIFWSSRIIIHKVRHKCIHKRLPPRNKGKKETRKFHVNNIHNAHPSRRMQATRNHKTHTMHYKEVPAGMKIVLYFEAQVEINT